MEAVAYPQGKTFEAAVMFANAEGRIPAPECGHGLRAAIDEALAAKETGEEKVILFNYCGHGFLDLADGVTLMGDAEALRAALLDVRTIDHVDRLVAVDDAYYDPTRESDRRAALCTR